MPKHLDRAAELRAQFGTTLAPGESFGVVQPVRHALGSDTEADAARAQRAHGAVERVAGGPPDPGRRRGVFERVADVVVSAVTNTSPVSLPAPNLGDPNGTALIGETGSRAVWLRDLMGWRHCVLATTRRRWFVLGDAIGAPQRYRALAAGTPEPYDVLGEIPRDQIQDVRSAPHGVARGRVEIHFVDGSMLAVSALTRDGAEALASST